MSERFYLSHYSPNVIAELFNLSGHTPGDKDCPECYAAAVPCACGGLAHVTSFDEDASGQLYDIGVCDRCGLTFHEEEGDFATARNLPRAI